MILDRKPGSDALGGLRRWGRGQNLNFSEYDLAVYQIKVNGTCSNMVENIFRGDPPPPAGGGDKNVNI